MKKLLLYPCMALAVVFTACGGQQDPEAEKKYTDSVAEARYEAKKAEWDSIQRVCEDQKKEVQDQIDSLNNAIEQKKPS